MDDNIPVIFCDASLFCSKNILYFFLENTGTIDWDWTQGFGGGPQETEANIGDIINFSWSGKHNVYSLPDENAFMNCDFSSGTLLSSTSPYQHILIGILPQYFACEVPGHCDAGQKLKVTGTAFH